MRTYPERLRRRHYLSLAVCLLFFLDVLDVLRLGPAFKNGLTVNAVVKFALLGALFATMFFFFGFRARIRRALRLDDGTLNLRVCEECLYDLRFAPSSTCPECGRLIPDNLEERWRRGRVLNIVAWVDPTWKQCVFTSLASMLALGVIVSYSGFWDTRSVGWWALGGAGVALALGSLPYALGRMR